MVTGRNEGALPRMLSFPVQHRPMIAAFQPASPHTFAASHQTRSSAPHRDGTYPAVPPPVYPATGGESGRDVRIQMQPRIRESIKRPAPESAHFECVELAPALFPPVYSSG